MFERIIKTKLENGFGITAEVETVITVELAVYIACASKERRTQKTDSAQTLLSTGIVES
jgi:hypothetical protein